MSDVVKDLKDRVSDLQGSLDDAKYEARSVAEKLDELLTSRTRSTPIDELEAQLEALKAVIRGEGPPALYGPGWSNEIETLLALQNRPRRRVA